MKIVKDTEGYFMLTSNNCEIYLRYNGETVQKLPSLEHIALCQWGYNKGDVTVTTPYEMVMDHIGKFKVVKYEIADELGCSQTDLYDIVKGTYPEEFL